MRTLYLAIVPMLLILFLVACGSSDTPEPDATSDQPSTTTDQATETTDQATETTVQATETTVQATETTEQATETTVQATETTEQATETTEQATEDSDEVFKMQFVCINRSLQTCDLFTEYVARVNELSNGQLEIEITSFPELGISGTDMLDLLDAGTVEFTELPGNFVGGTWPFIEIAELYGLFPDTATQNKIFAAVRDDEVRIIRDRFGGEVIFYDYYPDQFFYSKRPLNTLSDFEGLKTRAHSVPLGDLINGLGAEARFVTFADVYPSLERGILDAGVTGSGPGYGQRWYEVTQYLVGPLYAHPHNAVVMNLDIWNSLPPHLQDLLKEEGAKTEAENLRLVESWDQEGVDKNVGEGMIFSNFTPEMRVAIRDTAINSSLPNWVDRVGGVDTEEVRIFNEKVGPIVGMRVNPDGTVSSVPVQ